MTSQILTIRRILGVRAKSPETTILFVDFAQAIDSIHKGKMEQILLTYSLLKVTVDAIMMLYKNRKAKVRSPDGDTDYFDIVAGVLQRDTLASYLLIICLDYVLRTSINKMKDKRFQADKGKKQRIPRTNNYRRGLRRWHSACGKYNPPKPKPCLHSLERTTAGIGLHVNADKTEYTCFNQRGDISKLNGSSLKLVGKFTYLGSSVSSTKTDINTWLAKAWTDIDRPSVIWKSDLTDKIKRSFFQAAVASIVLYGCTTWTLTKRMEKKLDSF